MRITPQTQSGDNALMDFAAAIRQRESCWYGHVPQNLLGQGCLGRYSPALDATVRELLPQIHYIRFRRHAEAAHTMLRFQEFYESPRLKGHVFTRSQFEQLLRAQTDRDVRSYAAQFIGFNIPWYVLRPFMAGAFDPLSAREKALLAYFADVPPPFYVIASSESSGSLGVVIHELAHGLWAMRDGYRRRAEAIVRSLPADDRMKITRYLERICHVTTHADETHAYLLDDGCHRHLRLRHSQAQKHALRRLFNEYCGVWNFTAMAA